MAAVVGRRICRLGGAPCRLERTAHSAGRLARDGAAWVAVFSTTAVWLAAVILSCSDALAAEPLSQDDYAVVTAICKPGDGEAAWASIPWEIDLWQARRRAAKEGKPIVLWEMDGHPLGCT